MNPANISYRGSRKHVLDWVQSPQFRTELNEMLKPTGAVTNATDRWIPIVVPIFKTAV